MKILLFTNYKHVGGCQATTPAFGSPDFGQTSCGCQLKGSRVTPYAQTPEQGLFGTQNSQKLQSISAMPSYKAKSHEELRWEDYHAVDKGNNHTIDFLIN